MSQKRCITAVEEGYEEFNQQSTRQTKRQKTLELHAKEATLAKVREIVNREFSTEIHNKELEADQIDQRLNEAQLLMDRLRACVVASFYVRSEMRSQASDSSKLIHPAVRRLLDSAPRASSSCSRASKAMSYRATHSDVSSGASGSRSSDLVVKTEPFWWQSTNATSLDSIPAACIASVSTFSSTILNSCSLAKSISFGKFSSTCTTSLNSLTKSNSFAKFSSNLSINSLNKSASSSTLTSLYSSKSNHNVTLASNCSLDSFTSLSFRPSSNPASSAYLNLVSSASGCRSTGVHGTNSLLVGSNSCSRTEEERRGDRFKDLRTVIIGNVSKYLVNEKNAAAKMNATDDPVTHKWAVYVRAPPGEPEVSGFIDRVVFYLHPSYKPNDVIVISRAPFKIERRGWGEFPVRVQLYLRTGKVVNVIHQLKLDNTYTGLATVGSEKEIKVELVENSGAGTSGQNLFLPDHQSPDDLNFTIKSEPSDEVEFVQNSSTVQEYSDEMWSDLKCYSGGQSAIIQDNSDINQYCESTSEANLAENFISPVALELSKNMLHSDSSYDRNMNRKNQNGSSLISSDNCVASGLELHLNDSISADKINSDNIVESVYSTFADANVTTNDEISLCYSNSYIQSVLPESGGTLHLGGIFVENQQESIDSAQVENDCNRNGYDSIDIMSSEGQFYNDNVIASTVEETVAAANLPQLSCHTTVEEFLELNHVKILSDQIVYTSSPLYTNGYSFDDTFTVGDTESGLASVECFTEEMPLLDDLADICVDNMDTFGSTVATNSVLNAGQVKLVKDRTLNIAKMPSHNAQNAHHVAYVSENGASLGHGYGFSSLGVNLGTSSDDIQNNIIETTVASENAVVESECSLAESNYILGDITSTLADSNYFIDGTNCVVDANVALSNANTVLGETNYITGKTDYIINEPGLAAGSTNAALSETTCVITDASYTHCGTYFQLGDSSLAVDEANFTLGEANYTSADTIYTLSAESTTSSITCESVIPTITSVNLTIATTYGNALSKTSVISPQLVSVTSSIMSSIPKTSFRAGGQPQIVRIFKSSSFTKLQPSAPLVVQSVRGSLGEAFGKTVGNCVMTPSLSTISTVKAQSTSLSSGKTISLVMPNGKAVQVAVAEGVSSSSGLKRKFEYDSIEQKLANSEKCKIRVLSTINSSPQVCKQSHVASLSEIAKVNASQSSLAATVAQTCQPQLIKLIKTSGGVIQQTHKPTSRPVVVVSSLRNPAGSSPILINPSISQNSTVSNTPLQVASAPRAISINSVQPKKFTNLYPIRTENQVLQGTDVNSNEAIKVNKVAPPNGIPTIKMPSKCVKIVAVSKPTLALTSAAISAYKTYPNPIVAGVISSQASTLSIAMTASESTQGTVNYVDSLNPSSRTGTKLTNSSGSKVLTIRPINCNPGSTKVVKIMSQPVMSSTTGVKFEPIIPDPIISLPRKSRKNYSQRKTKEIKMLWTTINGKKIAVELESNDVKSQKGTELELSTSLRGSNKISTNIKTKDIVSTKGTQAWDNSFLQCSSSVEIISTKPQMELVRVGLEANNPVSYNPRNKEQDIGMSIGKREDQEVGGRGVGRIVLPNNMYVMLKSKRDPTLLQLKSVPSSDEKQEPWRSISVNYYECMEDLVSSLVQYFPLVGMGIDRSTHPYCSSRTREEFLSHSVGKRRADELCRAGAMQRALETLLSDRGGTLGSETVWSKKCLIVWCRQHLYTPIGLETRMRFEKLSGHSTGLNEQPARSIAFSTLTGHASLVEGIRHRADVRLDDDDDVDILGVEVGNRTEVKVKTETSPKRDFVIREIRASSIEAQFVNEVAQQVGVRMCPVPVLPDEVPHVLSSTAEEMIAAAMKGFLRELFHSTAAHIWNDNRLPDEIRAADLCKTISSSKRCWFLTNAGLGVEPVPTEQEDNAVPH